MRGLSVVGLGAASGLAAAPPATLPPGSPKERATMDGEASLASAVGTIWSAVGTLYWFSVS